MKTRTQRNRLLSMLFVLVMVLALLPTTAFAISYAEFTITIHKTVELDGNTAPGVETFHFELSDTAAPARTLKDYGITLEALNLTTTDDGVGSFPTTFNGLIDPGLANEENGWDVSILPGGIQTLFYKTFVLKEIDDGKDDWTYSDKTHYVTIIFDLSTGTASAKEHDDIEYALYANGYPDGAPFTNTYSRSNYTLTFDSNGGSEINSITRPAGTTVDLSEYLPTREGYTCTGWYADKSISERISSVTLTTDRTVYAGWEFNGALNDADHVQYVSGYPDGLVRPGSNITRAETAMMLYRLLTPARRTEITVTSSNFPDVDIGVWYGVAACSMAKGDYIIGYNDGTFGGNRQITRAEFVTMLVRFIGKAEGSKSFSDVDKTHWAYDFISTATAAGWIDGYADGTFGPGKLITRAEAMTILNRVLTRGVDADSTLLSFKVWPDNDKDAWYYYEVIEATNGHEYTGSRPSERWTTILT